MNTEQKDWWKSFIDSGNQALSVTEQIQRAVNATRPTMDQALLSLQPAIPAVADAERPDAFRGSDSATQKDQLRQLGVLTDKDDKNANMLHDAIWGSAAQLGSVLVGALNVGGGGRGSNIGGKRSEEQRGLPWLGYIFGGGPVGGAIGSTIGNFIGSAIGGLFDHHKKAVDHNTEAVKALTQALIQNAPAVSRSTATATTRRCCRAWGSAAARIGAASS
jgi:hypothetical protein